MLILLKIMVTRSYPTDVSVLLNPVWFDRIPTGRLGIDSMTDFVLDKPMWFDFKIVSDKEIVKTLTIEHYGKTNRDTQIDTGKDTAIIIEQIKFNDINSPKFVWQGVYHPKYPDNYSQNTPLETALCPCTYLGWNGVWKLEFSLPIYTWIHRIENLGWLYD